MRNLGCKRKFYSEQYLWPRADERKDSNNDNDDN